MTLILRWVERDAAGAQWLRLVCYWPVTKRKGYAVCPPSRGPWPPGTRWVWRGLLSFAAMAVKVVAGGQIWGSPVSFAAMAVKVVGGRDGQRRQGPISERLATTEWGRCSTQTPGERPYKRQASDGRLTPAGVAARDDLPALAVAVGDEVAARRSP